MGAFARWFGAAAAGSLVLTGTVGCVSPKEYNNVKAERDSALLQRDIARAQATGLSAEAEVYKQQVALLTTSDNGKESTITQLSNETTELRNQLAEVNSRYSDAMSDNSPGASTGGS